MKKKIKKWGFIVKVRAFYFEKGGAAALGRWTLIIRLKLEGVRNATLNSAPRGITG